MAAIFRRVNAQDNPAADYAASLNKRQIIDGRLVDVTIPIGQISAIVSHGLGRAYRGAFMAGTSKPLYPVSAYLPVDVASQVDVTKYVVVATTAVVATSDLRCQFWIF